MDGEITVIYVMGPAVFDQNQMWIKHYNETHNC